MTIRRRLLLLLLPALLALMLGGGAVDYWIAVATTRDVLDRALASSALAAAAYVTTQAGASAQAASARATTFLRGDGAGGVRSYAVTAADGRLIAGDAQLAAVRSADLKPHAGSRPTFADVMFAGQPMRVARLALPLEGGSATVTVAETRERRLHSQRVMLVGKLLVDFAELDLTLLWIYAAVYFGLRPLRWLRDQAEGYSLRELQRFDDTRAPGELRPLVVAFNRVLELLQEAALAQRRFVADAAHQMRTPVAGLLAQIELLTQDARAHAVAGDLNTLHRAAQSMAHSANQLLALARAEPLSALQGEHKPVALDVLVQELVERYLSRADQAGIDLGADPGRGCLLGNSWLLEDLLGNLIDNALKYTPRGGHVTVRSGMDAGQPFLEVEDDGPGIAEGERARVRERFYRSPGSPGIGAGLGLAIVDEIARAHEAVLNIGAGSAGYGTRMRVCFAAPSSAAA